MLNKKQKKYLIDDLLNTLGCMRLGGSRDLTINNYNRISEDEFREMSHSEYLMIISILDELLS